MSSERILAVMAYKNASVINTRFKEFNFIQTRIPYKKYKGEDSLNHKYSSLTKDSELKML